VNQVGEIVHGCTDDFHGAPNKNIGNSFLIVWRLSEAAADRRPKLADMAMMSFVRIVAEVSRSRVLAAYREHPGLLQHFPQYRVEMGLGLHCGWAIEGAIGSELKIDASYLSPNVNVASQLEAATKEFSVWILLSHSMYRLCSPGMASVCRQIDHVIVRGLKQPLRLYTIDLDSTKVEVQQHQPFRIKRNRFKIRQARDVVKNEKWSQDFRVCEAFTTDEDLVAMRSTYSTEFFQRFAVAYRNYEAGEWLVARDMFLTCRPEGFGMAAVNLERWPDDGPSKTLLSFMQRMNWNSGNEWHGFRELLGR